MTPTRRRLVAALGGAGLLGGGAWVASGGLSDDRGVAVEVETLDARGSSAGRRRVPVDGAVTVIDLFATWCGPCVEQMAELRTAREAVGDAAFVSVTNERFGGGFDRAALREWWRDHGGAWTLGHDPESALSRELGAGGLPFLAVADADGRVVWRHRGVADAGEIRRRVADARGGDR